MEMILNKENFVDMLNSSCQLIDKNIDKLGNIDAKFGDGDHGVTMSKISNIIKKCINNWENESVYEFFENMGEEIMDVNGGSAGPLYGTFFQGLGEGIENSEEIDNKVFKKMILSSLENMQMITKAKVGDKTMMDTLIPAAECAKKSSLELPECITEIADAACRGAEKSKEFPSKFGRARFFKDETIGYMDAGAMSLSLIFMGFNEGIKK
ncbi:dihydroxyacetone kinase subunit DhaL [Ilyobacter polytropus]|nr:dihydroxyacetone kinase subunit DhaL [Ilyobacter polytropus]